MWHTSLVALNSPLSHEQNRKQSSKRVLKAAGQGQVALQFRNMFHVDSMSNNDSVVTEITAQQRLLLPLERILYMDIDEHEVPFPCAIDT